MSHYLYPQKQRTISVSYTHLLKERRNKYLKDIELFESLKIKINEASFNEHWEELIELCNKALSIKSDDSIKRYLEKAQDLSLIHISKY